MGFLSGRSMRADASWSPLDDRWYGSLGFQSDAGIAVSAQTILNCGAVLAAVRFKAQSFGLCPPKVYIEKPGNIREEDRGHYLFRVLRDPNAWQTGFQWRQHTAFNTIVHGNAYNEIMGGDGFFVEELRPLKPECMRIVDQKSDGSLVYEYTPHTPGVAPKRLSQSDVLHFRDLSQNGYAGIVTYQLLRNIVGIALSAEKHAAKFMAKGARIGGVLTSKATLPPTVRQEAEKSLQLAWGGPENEGKIALLGAEFDFKAVTMDHQKSQFLELRDFQVEEVLRALGVPGVVVGYSKNLMGYASADAFFEKGGIKHCLLPLVENFQDQIDKDLILKADQHYCKFSLATLLRASTKDEWELLIKASGGPIISTNEARRIIDRNPDPDPESDKIARPTNMSTGVPDDKPGQPPVPPPAKPKPTPPDDDDAEQARRFAQLAVNAAARVIRRQVSALQGSSGVGAVRRYAGNAKGWGAWVAKFREEQPAVVERELGADAAAARAFVELQAVALSANGAAAAENWEATWYPALEAMALGEPWQELLNQEEPAA